MSRAYTPVLVGVVSLVSEIWLPFKNNQISLLDHGNKISSKLLLLLLIIIIIIIIISSIIINVYTSNFSYLCVL